MPRVRNNVKAAQIARMHRCIDATLPQAKEPAMHCYRLTYTYDAVSSTHEGYVRQEASGDFRTYGPMCATLMCIEMVEDTLGGRNLTIDTIEAITDEENAT